MAKILIVEDNPQNMKLAVLVLENAGHEVLRAADAQTGINLAMAYRPELVLMNIQLPGMDGLAATRILKQSTATRDIKIFALTAFAMKDDQDKMRAAGCDGYIPKPFRYQDFLETVTAALAETT
ncbi:MAG TPA: response regulator [Novimethylophilus sp.]|jgi:two-component system cell cycle response regulator DivK|uniref:response regulator n=1 Tax=Novimethylophilus sp. TaxID=2137426 RepID=UPI002F3EE70B